MHQSAPFRRGGRVLGSCGGTIKLVPGYALLACKQLTNTLGNSARNLPEFAGILPEFVPEFAGIGHVLGYFEVGEVYCFDSPELDSAPNHFGSILPVPYGPAPQFWSDNDHSKWMTRAGDNLPEFVGIREGGSSLNSGSSPNL